MRGHWYLLEEKYSCNALYFLCLPILLRGIVHREAHKEGQNEAHIISATIKNHYDLMLNERLKTQVLIQLIS